MCEINVIILRPKIRNLSCASPARTQITERARIWPVFFNKNHGTLNTRYCVPISDAHCTALLTYILPNNHVAVRSPTNRNTLLPVVTQKCPTISYKSCSVIVNP